MDIDSVFKSQRETRWVNKQRTLVVSNKGITDRARQLMLDVFNLLPHSKKESKIEKGNWDDQIKELCQINSCRSFIFFESRKGRNLYIWIGRYPNGPTIKYYVENLHNSQDNKLQGNCMKGSRPILSFDSSFNDSSVMKLQKELFIHAFNVPKYHPKSMPCCDRVISFIKEGEQSNKIWMRQYEIQYEKVGKEVIRNELSEIGPRLILNPICILEGSMSGRQLYKNVDFVGPKQVHLFQIIIKKRLEKIKDIRNEMDDRKKKQEKKENVFNNLQVEDEEIDHIYDGEYIEKKVKKIDFGQFKSTNKVVEQ